MEQHTGMLWAVARSYRLDAADAADVVQTTWLRLLEHLHGIEDPTRLVGWLVTTTRRECLRVLRRTGRERPTAAEETVLDLEDETAEPLDARLLADERAAALWAAFNRMPERCRQLLRVAVAVPLPYEEIASKLDMPVGSIGPTRGRCLDKLRSLLSGSVLIDTGDAEGRP